MNRYRRGLNRIRREMPLPAHLENQAERALVALSGDHVVLPAQWTQRELSLTPEMSLLLAVLEVAWLELRSRVVRLRREASAFFAYPDHRKGAAGYNLRDACETFGADVGKMQDRARARWLLGPGTERRVTRGRGHAKHRISAVDAPLGRRKGAGRVSGRPAPSDAPEAGIVPLAAKGEER